MIKQKTEAENQLLIAQKKLNQETDNTTKQTLAAKKAAQDISNDYKQLSLAYNDAALRAKNYSLTLGAQHPITLQATADAKAMGAQLKELDASVGQNQRNVGNYGGAIGAAFNKAWTGIRVAANILPGLGISGLLLAVYEGAVFAAKGIGLFSDKVDNLKKVTEDYQEALSSNNKQAAVEATNLKVLEKVATDNTKAQSVRLAAVKELQDTYPAYLGNLSQEAILSGKAASEIDKITQALYTKAIAEAASSRSADSAKNLLDLKKEENDLLKKEKETRSEIAANENKRGKQGVIGGSSLGVTSTELDSYDKAVAKMTGIKDAIEKNRNAQLAFGKDIQFYNDEAAKLYDSYYKLEIKKAKDNSKELEDLEEKKRKAIYDMQKAVFEAQSAQIEAIQKDETNSFQLRLVATEQYLKKQFQLIKLEEDFKLNAPKATEEEKAQFVAEAQTKRIESELKTLGTIKAITDAHNKQLLDDTKKFEDAKKKAAEDAKKKLDTNIQEGEDGLRDRQMRSTEQLNNSLTRLNQDFISGKISSYKDYEDQKRQIEESAARESIQLQIDYLKKQLLLEGLSSKQIQKYKTEISELEKKLSDGSVARTKKRTDEEQKAFEKLLDEVQRSVNAVSDAIKASVTGNIDAQKNAVQEQIDLIDKQKEAEIAAANASTLSAQEKADKIATINAVAQSKKEALERRQRELDQQKARSERAFQIFNIIGNTAIAVTKFLSSRDVAGAIVAGIIGAAQLATVLATPIPKYRFGTESHKGGMAIVGDGGRKEMAIMPDGSMFETPDRPTLVNLPAGAKVKPDAAAYMATLNDTAMKMTIQSGGRAVKPEVFDATHFKALEKEMRGIKDAINAKPVAKVINTHSGLKYQTESMQGYMAYINKYFES